MPLSIKTYQLDFLRGDEMRLLKDLADSDDFEVFHDQFFVDIFGGVKLRNQLILRGLMPYTLYAGLTMGFYMQMFAKEDKAERATPVRITQLLCLAWLSYFEFRQLLTARILYF